MFDKIFWVGMSQPQAHGIGDHAQTVAIRKILEKNYPDSEITIIDRSRTEDLFNERVKDSDLILINSSCDFGDFYPPFHEWRRRIVCKFPKNKIVQLPITVYYRNAGEYELDKQIFGGHKHFLLMARDLVSYDLVKDSFDCKTMFFPDFVFSLKPEIPDVRRKGVLAVIREDTEAHFNDRLYYFLSSHRKTQLIGKAYYHTIGRATLRRGINKAKKMIKAFSRDVFVGDIQMSTVDITDENREQIVNDTLAYYTKFKVTVTDRFHGVVFSMLTRTPCIALTGGIPHKISGYKGLLGGNVKFVDSVDEIPKVLNSALSNYSFNDIDFSDYFDNFKNIIEADFNEKPKVVTTTNILDIIKSRRSVRRWNSNPVTKSKIDTVLTAGMYAPSAGNIQAVRFVVFTDKNKIPTICKNTCGWFQFNFPPVIIAVLYDLEKAKSRGFDFTKSHKWKRFIWQDSAAAMENMLIMAKSLGLETCWVSIPPKEGSFINKLFRLSKYGDKEKIIREILKVGDRYVLTSLLFMGYSDTEGNPKSRHQGHSIQRNFDEFVLNPRRD
ncbi:MAG TPA: hypothetical protein ENN36_05720 [Candidatus Bathyarchaeota archaeon]|nr:hypothetical protein [Candidatus Bathyarchaeota archaeon]